MAGHTYVLHLSDASTCRFFGSLRSVSLAPDLRAFIQIIVRKNGRRATGDCKTFNLTFAEDLALQTAILRYNHSSRISGEITIQRLSPDGHKRLLEESEAINSDECGCDRIAFVERIGGLTAHLKHDGNCSTNSMCRVVPPVGCFSRFVYDASRGPLKIVIKSLLIGLPIFVLFALLALLGRQVFRLIKRNRATFLKAGGGQP